MNKYFDRA